MGFEGKAERKAKDAERHKPLFEKAPDTKKAETYRNSTRIAVNHLQFTVRQKEADENARDSGGIVCRKIPHEERNKDEAPKNKRHPNYVSRAIR